MQNHFTTHFEAIHSKITLILFIIAFLFITASPSIGIADNPLAMVLPIAGFKYFFFICKAEPGLIIQKRARWISCLILLIAMSGCKPGSVLIRGDDCRMNGSFEHVKNGFPVNWCYYAMETVPDGDFDILIDSVQSKEGKRSLKFQVRTCSSIGGWYSPGFFEEFKVLPGQTYKISFCVLNQGCDFKVGVSTGMKGNPGPSETILRTNGKYSDWHYFEYSFTIPLVNDNIRFEANILSPGTIWFDDIRIEGLTDKDELTLYPYRGSEECK